MNITDLAGLLAAGLAAGTINAMAGGGTLIVFPALVAYGLPPISANVTNSIAVSPGYVAAVLGSRMELAAYCRRHGVGSVLALVPTAAAGTAIGCALLLATPARAFELVVPFLILAATAILAARDRLRALVGHPHNMKPLVRRVAVHTTVGLGCVYGGYFGAALGVILVAVIALVSDEGLVRLTALKNWVASVCGLTTVVAFATFGPVDWFAVAVVAPAALVGGYLGARLGRRLPGALLRATIVSIGLVVATVLLVRALAT